MDICEKISYIKGLAEGLDLDGNTKEGKVIYAILDLLGDMTEEICEIEDGLDDITEQLDAVDEDLSSVEEIVYDEDGCDCGCCDDDVYEVECPNCHDTIYLDEEMLEENGIDCPNCGTPLEFDFDDNCEVEAHEVEEKEPEAE
ncbi:MAG: hypothetical protein IKZ47_07340 [Clostridia bacterium]|nr:hypothetical protein [Clostridia bacterium]